MSAALLPVLKQRFADSNFNPLSGGKLYSYVAGTSTPAATYTDESAGTPNANPVVLDADGYAPVWLGAGSYKFVLKDANGVEIFTVDDVSVDGSAVDLTSPWIEHAVTNGQAAANLAGETLDSTAYSSNFYECEIIRGTTVIANGWIALQFLNGTARVIIGGMLSDVDHGVTFSVSQASTVAQLKAALDSGAGNGTVKLRSNKVPA
jgi:hypothetical protein